MSVDLIPEHVELLAAAAISTEVAEAAGVRTISDMSQLPEGLRWVKNTPGILFEWRSIDGATTPQYRPDVPVTISAASLTR